MSIVSHSQAAQMIRLWSDLVNASPDESTILDLPSWISRATLDAIGLAAFDYEFGALDDGDNELSKSFRNITFVITWMFKFTDCLVEISLACRQKPTSSLRVFSNISLQHSSCNSSLELNLQDCSVFKDSAN